MSSDQLAMHMTRIAVTEEVDSYFVVDLIPLSDAGEIGHLSQSVEVGKIIFRHNDADYDYDWHCALRRPYIVMLDGEIEIEVSCGEKRTFRGGDVLLIEDTWGKGHRTRLTNGQPRGSLFIPADPST
ncbi:MAG: hypothetical protein ACOC0P_01030 [Planctomycetota bacterium]